MKRSKSKTNFWPRWVRDAGIYQQMVDIGTFARSQFKWRTLFNFESGFASGSPSVAGVKLWADTSSKARSKWSRRSISSTTQTWGRPTVRSKTCSRASRTWGWSRSGQQGLIPWRNFAKSKKTGARRQFLVIPKKRNMFCHRIQKLDTKLLEFRNLIRETVYDACRSSTKSKEKRNIKSLKDPKKYKFSLKEHILWGWIQRRWIWTRIGRAEESPTGN